MKKTAVLPALLMPIILVANQADELVREGMSYDPAFAASKPDCKKAFEIYKRAAEMGDPEGMYRLYEAYRTAPDNPDNLSAQNKYGITQDYAEAFVWISLACDYCEDSRMKTYTNAKAVAAWEIRYYDLKKSNAPVPDGDYALNAIKKYKSLKIKMDAKLKK